MYATLSLHANTSPAESLYLQCKDPEDPAGLSIWLHFTFQSYFHNQDAREKGLKGVHKKLTRQTSRA